ncbi:MAG: hypothetical protein KatS3mg003_1050 [Candidatus Nitrosocaldaceae archaeon]|nr:MAG: hypothetical protein KatS3mg003_1050 [Candidatus Nitrosocaldaceae archaeon]
MANAEVLVKLIAKDEASNKINESITKINQKLESTNTSTTNLESRTQRLKSAFNGLSSSLKSNALGLTTVASSALSLYNAYDNLGSQEIAVQKVADALEAKKVALARAQEKVNKLVQEGKTNTAEYQIALEDLRVKEQQVKTAEDDLADKMDDLSRAKLQFALSVIPTVVSSIGTLNGVLGSTGLTGALSKIPSMLNAVKIASISAFITNPVGLALIGISALVTALVFNIGGLRDAFINAGKTIWDFIKTYLSPLASIIEGIAGFFGQITGSNAPTPTMPELPNLEVAPNTEAFTKDMQDMNKQLENVQLVTDLTADDLEELNKKFIAENGILNSLDQFNNKLNTLKATIDDLNLSIEHKLNNVTLRTSNKRTSIKNRGLDII